MDQDGDGFDAVVDCDDQDASVHPGAEEVPYDGVDQDCVDGDLQDVDGDGHVAWQVGGDDCDDDDDAVQPGAVEVPYDGVDQDCDGGDLVDVDGDGYKGELAGGDDCNDADPTVHPYAEDVPNDGVDSDCDGEDPVQRDADGDGYVDVADGGDDCDDGDPTVHPGAMEVCYDGVDQDCDGYGTEPPASLWELPDLDSSVAWAWGPEDLGAVIAPGDVDGDGRDDLVIAAIDDATAGQRPGGVYLLPGAPCDPVDLRIEAAGELHGASGQELGYALAPAGDVDDDGLADFWVMDQDNGWIDKSTSDFVERLFLYVGPAAGELSTEDAVATLAFDVPGTAPALLDLDFNADGVRDVAVTFTLGGDGGYLVAGPFAGERSISADHPDRLDVAGLASLGDLDGDGVEDAAGIRYDGGQEVLGFVGGQATPWDQASAAWSLGPAEPVRYLLAVKGLGDTNGDGVDDFGVDVWWDPPTADGEWATYVFTGLPDVASDLRGSADAVVLTSGVSDGVWAADDVDGDAQDDVLVTSGSVNAEVRVLPGPVEGIVPSWDAAAVLWDSAAPIQASAAPWAGAAGDLNADGFGDLYIRNPSYVPVDAEGEGPWGRVSIVFGGPL